MYDNEVFDSVEGIAKALAKKKRDNKVIDLHLSNKSILGIAMKMGLSDFVVEHILAQYKSGEIEYTDFGENVEIKSDKMNKELDSHIAGLSRLDIEIITDIILNSDLCNSDILKVLANDVYSTLDIRAVEREILIEMGVTRHELHERYRSGMKDIIVSDLKQYVPVPTISKTYNITEQYINTILASDSAIRRYSDEDESDIISLLMESEHSIYRIAELTKTSRLIVQEVNASNLIRWDKTQDYATRATYTRGPVKKGPLNNANGTHGFRRDFSKNLLTPTFEPNSFETYSKMFKITLEDYNYVYKKFKIMHGMYTLSIAGEYHSVRAHSKLFGITMGQAESYRATLIRNLKNVGIPDFRFTERPIIGCSSYIRSRNPISVK